MFNKNAVYAEMVVELSTGEEQNGVPTFLPHNEVSGSVIITPEADINAENILIALNWFTEGRGDTDRGVIAQRDMGPIFLSSNIPQSFEFSFPLPDQPWSFAGHYINIIWAVTISVERKPARLSLTYDHRIVMSPTRKVIAPVSTS